MLSVLRVRWAILLLSLGGLGGLAHADAPVLSHRDRLYDATGIDGNLFVVGHPGLVLRSRDGGKSFESVAGGQHDEALFSIAFNRKGQGAIVGRSGFVLITSDKGATFQKSQVVLGEERPSLFGVDVLDNGVIVAVGDFGAIARSEDQGKTWTRSPYSIEGPTDGAVAAPECPTLGAEGDNSDVIQEARLTDVAFVDDMVGFVVGEFGLALRTDDGGRTFKRQNSCTDRTLYSLSVIGATGVLAAGADGGAVETRDGGLTWTVRPTGTSEHLFGVWADGSRAVVTGAAGTLLMRKGDGPFTRVDTGLHSWLASAWFNDKGQGVIVGGRAHLLLTQDGGTTRQRIFGE